jgi:hydroxymethylpyrimidine/phosphomethylpyrimidine kinase
MRNHSSPPVALTIAGSDNSAGAGLQADLKTFGAFGVYGVTAATCVVAEVPGMVSAIQPLETNIVAEQIGLCFRAFPVGALKTGMLYSREIIETVAHCLEANTAPVVVDPVMVASSGDPLLKPDAVEAYKTLLFPRAALITPNADELAVLADCQITSLEVMHNVALGLASKFGIPFLAKGGHLRGDRAVDWLAFPDGAALEFSEPFIPGANPHGTGCTYSSAITAALARGISLIESVARAKKFITRAIAERFSWVDTTCLNHLFNAPD